MPARLSAVDAVSPAFEQTKRLLFSPFRFGHWARMAVVTLMTGEIAGGWSGGSRFNLPAGTGGGGRKPDDFALLVNAPWDQLKEFLPWVLVGVVAVIAIGLLFAYIASVFRFILLDAVLFDRYRLRAGWDRWQSQGVSYFLWQISFGLVSLAVLALVIGGPIVLAWRAGVFHEADKHWGLLFGGGALLLFLFLGILFAAALMGVLAKDFVVPVMALDNVGVLAAWRRVLPMLSAEKLAYTGYILMKIVLAVGSAILFGIINVIVLLVLVLILGALGAAAFFGGAAAGLTWNFYTIAAAVLAGVVALGGLLYVISFTSVPAAVFFQSYTLHFFGGRYATLGARLAPPPAAPPPEPSPAGS